MFPALHGILSQSGAATWYAGLTDLVAVYQPKGAASLAASYVNLVNPGTYNAAPGVAPTFAGATGWTFNGTTQYLTTGITPASGWSILVRYSNYVSGARYLIGQRNLTGDRRWYLALRAGDLFYAAGNVVIVAPSLAGGVLAISGQQGYRNGVADGGAIGAWSSPNSAIELYLGVLNEGGSNVGYFAGDIQAIAICSSIQTADQIAAASTAVELI